MGEEKELERFREEVPNTEDTVATNGAIGTGAGQVARIGTIQACWKLVGWLQS